MHIIIHTFAHLHIQNIKERHVNDDLGIPNPNLLSIKDDGNIANMIMSEKHQDTGESKDKDYREKANVEEQQIGDKNADSAIDSMGQVEKEYPNDVDQMGNIQGEYMDDKEQYKNDNYPEQIDRNVVQDGEEKRVGDYGEQGREDEGYQDGDKDGGMGEKNSILCLLVCNIIHIHTQPTIICSCWSTAEVCRLVEGVLFELITTLVHN